MKTIKKYLNDFGASFNKVATPKIKTAFRHIILFTKEFFFIRAEGKKPVFTPSATKTFLTIFRIMLLIMLCITIYPFWYKIAGSNAAIRDSLTPAVLAAYVGLDAVLAVLTGYLQNLYNKFKSSELEELSKKK